MKMQGRWVPWLAATLLLCACLQAGALQAGSGRAVAELSPGIPMDGLTKRQGRPSTKLLDPIQARCVYLEGDTEAVFWVTLDVFAIREPLRERVEGFLPTTDRPARLILTATQTLNGPGGAARNWLGKTRAGRFSPDVLDVLAQAAGNAMETALASRRRATTDFGRANLRGVWQNPMLPDEEIEIGIPILRVDDSDGNPISVALTLPGVPLLPSAAQAFALSAGLPGQVRSALEQSLGSDVAVLCVPGITGNREWNLDGETTIASRIEQVVGETLRVTTGIRGRETNVEHRSQMLSVPDGFANAFLPAELAAQGLAFTSGRITFLPMALDAATVHEISSIGQGVHMVVGMTDGHWGRLAAADSYAYAPEMSMPSFFNPNASKSVEASIQSLWSGEPLGSAATKDIAAPTRTDSPFFSGVILEGGAYARGYQRGQVFREEIRAAFEARVAERLRNRELFNTKGPWRWMPRPVDAAPLLFPDLAMTARPWLGELSEDAIQELQGLADGAELPFDAVWILHCEKRFAQQSEKKQGSIFLYWSGDGDTGPLLLVGRLLDPGERVVVAEMRPEKGRRWIQLGSAWNVDSPIGINDAGIALLFDTEENPNSTFTDHINLSEALRTENKLEDAMSALMERGTRELWIADRPKEHLRYLHPEQPEIEQEPLPLPTRRLNIPGLDTTEARIYLKSLNSTGGHPDVDTVFTDLEQLFKLVNTDSEELWMIVALEPRTNRLHLRIYSGNGIVEQANFTAERGP